MFVGDYLTTKGQLPEADYRMIEELGFVVAPDEPQASGTAAATCGPCQGEHK